MTVLPEIRSERLRLIPLSPLDAADVTTLITEWDVIRMLTRPPYPYTIEDARNWLATAQDLSWEFAIYTDRFLGVVGITGHLGYWLGKPYWGRGYMTEAAIALIDAYFGRTGSHEIVSRVFVDNPGSARVLGKLGFVETGRSRQFCKARGSQVENIDVALTREDWRARSEASLDADVVGRD